MARSRSMTAKLSRLLSEVRAPVYVIDEHRTLVYVNAALEQWLGVAGDELVGKRCDYMSTSTSDRAAQIVASLCPPPTVVEGTTTATVLECTLPSGERSRRSVRFLPLGEDAIDCEGTIAVVSADEVDESDLAQPIPESDSLHLELQQFRQTQAGKYRLDRLVGKSAPMLRVRRQVTLAIQSGTRTVLIGPPGSGREHIARVIHFAGDDAHAPTLMPLACPLLDAELLQTSITTFARHATDNPTTRPATLLLCDADQLSTEAQNELFGFLALPGFDLHVLCTARRSLIALAEGGSFRRELAFALSTLEIELPPLSERRRDIPVLVQMFVEQQNAAGKEQLAGFDSDAMDALCDFVWEENVDELREVVVQCCEAASGGLIAREELSKHIRHANEAPVVMSNIDEPIVLDEVLAEVECEMIRRAMQLAKGNKTKAAELLGISRPRLHRRWEEIETVDFTEQPEG